MNKCIKLRVEATYVDENGDEMPVTLLDWATSQHQPLQVEFHHDRAVANTTSEDGELTQFRPAGRKTFTLNALFAGPGESLPLKTEE